MCDCEKAKIDLLEELLKEAVIHTEPDIDAKGNPIVNTDFDSSYIPLNAVMNKLYKLKGLENENNS